MKPLAPKTHRTLRPLEYRPGPSASEFFYCTEREVLFDGPVRSGKSRAAIEKYHYLLTRYPNSKMWIIRKTRAELTTTMLDVFENYVLPGTHYFLNGPNRAHRTSYQYRNGSEIYLGSLASQEHWQRIMGSEVNFILVDEATALTQDEWESLITRLSRRGTPYNQIAATCNPAFETHWLWKRFQEGKIHRIQSTLKDNPVFWSVERQDWTIAGRRYLKALEGLSGVKRKRLVDGIWCAAEGQVFPEFEIGTHLLRGTPPKADSYIGVIDWGYRDAMVIQIWGIHEGIAYLYSEYYREGMDIDYYSKLVDKYQKQYEVGLWLADPSRPDSIEALKTRLGIKIEGADNEIKHGLELIRSRLINKRILICPEYQDYRRLDKLPTAQNLVEEMYAYTWSKKTPDLPEPSDACHAVDCMRYLVNHLDKDQDPFWYSMPEPDKSMPEQSFATAG